MQRSVIALGSYTAIELNTVLGEAMPAATALFSFELLLVQRVFPPADQLIGHTYTHKHTNTHTH